MKKTVSIIIPVYNLEKYIVNCLESIFAQTYESLEIICIDDGSNDKSAEIIKRFAASDSRVKYFYHDNAGVSVARNHGLEIASGDYIMFVDVMIICIIRQLSCSSERLKNRTVTLSVHMKFIRRITMKKCSPSVNIKHAK